MNLTKANNQIRNACIAGTISGVFTLIAMLDTPTLFLDVLTIFRLTWGIYQKSRVCAVLMFIYFVLSRIIVWQKQGIGSYLDLLIVISFIYYFWQGIQGTFAYHKITRKANNQIRNAYENIGDLPQPPKIPSKPPALQNPWDKFN